MLKSSYQPNWEVMDLTDKIREIFETSKESKPNVDYDIRRLLENYINKIYNDAYELGYEQGYEKGVDENEK